MVEIGPGITARAAIRPGHATFLVGDPPACITADLTTRRIDARFATSAAARHFTTRLIRQVIGICISAREPECGRSAVLQHSSLS
jgi:hypothetical protein